MDAKNWQRYEREAIVLQANLYQIPLGTREIKLLDWETEKELTIVLDPRLPPHEQVKPLVRKSKKGKAGIAPLEKQIQELEQCLEEIQNGIIQAQEAENEAQLTLLEKEMGLEKQEKPQVSAPVKKLPYREYTTQSGAKIWVGKGAKDNDQLTFTHANGSDWWLHVNEYSGSHVVVKAKDGQKLDDLTLSDAMQLAIGQSKAPKRGKVEVCLTQVKNVKKFKGAKPGAVHISSHKKLLGEFDKERYDFILRLLP